VDAAITGIAEQAAKSIAAHGGESFALYGGGGQANMPAAPIAPVCCVRSARRNTFNALRPGEDWRFLGQCRCFGSRTAIPPRTCIIATCVPLG